MAKKKQLRKLRTGTVINATSKQQEMEVIKAIFTSGLTLRALNGIG